MQNEIVAVAIIHSYSAALRPHCILLLHFNAIENEMGHSAIFRCKRFHYEGGGIRFDAHIREAGQFSSIFVDVDIQDGPIKFKPAMQSTYNSELICVRPRPLSSVSPAKTE